ncbi:MAG: transglycosylase SLT domain-containing protein, partial [Gemmatimonadetes bacterium]|nr:transglycosylase SLT domain-containing protein [Gemmatimonadota bacterium]
MEGFTQGQIQRILKVQPLVDQWSKTRGLDPDLVNGVIWAESRFQTRALSPVGARGLMQVVPETQKGWEVETARTGDIWSPEH